MFGHKKARGTSLDVRSTYRGSDMPITVERTLKASRVSYIHALYVIPHGMAGECGKYTPRADIQCLALTVMIEICQISIRQEHKRRYSLRYVCIPPF